MSFFDDLGKKLTDASQSTIQKTKNVTDSLKYNSMISDEQKKIAAVEAEIGKLYMEKYADAPEEAFAGFVASIKESQAKIKELQETILQLKGAAQCPNCGAEVPNGSAFCSSCGTAMPKPVVVEEAPAPEVRFCTTCGAALNADSKFCTACGTPVGAAEVVVEEVPVVEVPAAEEA